MLFKSIFNANKTYEDAQSDNDDDDSADILEAILGYVGQREDAGCDDDWWMSV